MAVLRLVCRKLWAQLRPVLALRCGGMVTAIGNSTSQTAASWLVRTRRTRRLALDGFADPFTVADCKTVTAGLAAGERLAALLGPAVAEAFDGWPALPDEPPASGQSLEILVLPDWLELDACHRLGETLGQWRHPSWRASGPERLILRANAIGAWVALEQAHRALARRPDLRHVMIAAVDSACDPAQLRRAAQAGWLLHRGNDQGHVAGEAAACVHLTRMDGIGDLPAGRFALHRPALLQAGARLWPPAAGHAEAVRAPLESALRAALDGAGMRFEHIGHLSGDGDGSNWRALIETDALEHLSTGASLPHWKPALLLGQTGTPAGLIGWLLAAALHAGRIERVNTVLNWALAPSGEAAACVLERSPNIRQLP